MKQSKPTITADVENFLLIQDETPVGEIKLTRPEDAGLLAGFFEQSLDTLYIARSGVPLSADSQWFQSGQQLVVFEWVRVESRPKPGEKECNSYRYLFGLTHDGQHCSGIELTNFNPEGGQVAPHHGTLDEIYGRHFPIQPQI